MNTSKIHTEQNTGISYKDRNEQGQTKVRQGKQSWAIAGSEPPPSE